MLCTLGFVALLFLLKEPALILWRLFRTPKQLTSYGRWAVVTGATDGIGRAIALELAKQKMNILLVSRTEAKLIATSKEISDKYPGVEVDYLAIDFSHFDDKQKNVVAARVKELEGGVGVLVNNVGASYSFPKFFNELADDEVDYLMKLNIDSTLWMTRIVLPSMVEKASGCVVSLSSASAMAPCPLLAGYNGVKMFVNGLSQSLHEEYKGKGIHFQSQVPLYVTTKLAKIRKSSLTVPTPEVFAQASVSAMGHESLVSPYWSHALMLWVMSILNAVIPSLAINLFIMKPHLAIRKRGMKKAAKQNE